MNKRNASLFQLKEKLCDYHPAIIVQKKFSKHKISKQEYNKIIKLFQNKILKLELSSKLEFYKVLLHKIHSKSNLKDLLLLVIDNNIVLLLKNIYQLLIAILIKVLKRKK